MSTERKDVVSLHELKTNMREAHSSLRLAIKDAEAASNYVVFLDIKHAKALDEFCDFFLYD